MKVEGPTVDNKVKFYFFVFINLGTWNTGKKATINKCNKALKNLKAELHSETKCSKPLEPSDTIELIRDDSDNSTSSYTITLVCVIKHAA